MKRFLVVMAASSLLFAGCSSTPTPDLEATVQAAVEAAVEATQTAQPTNALTPEPTNTPTPEPTDTPVPTSTARPTDTPEPTARPPTLTPNPHDAAMEYMRTVYPWVEKSGTSYVKVVDMAYSVWNGGDLRFNNDPEWLSELGHEIGILTWAYENFVELDALGNVPPEMVEYHKMHTAALKDYVEFTDYVTNFIVSGEDFGYAVAYLGAGNEKLKLATEWLNKWGEGENPGKMVMPKPLNTPRPTRTTVPTRTANATDIPKPIGTRAIASAPIMPLPFMPTPDLLSDEVVEYLETILPWHEELEASLGKLDALTKAWKADMSLSDDPDWLLELDYEMSILTWVHEKLVELEAKGDVPPGWDAYHDLYRVAVENSIHYAEYLKKGVVYGSAEDMEKASFHLEGALAQIDSAAIYVEKWNRGIDPATLVTPILAKMTEVAEEKMPNTPIPTEPPATSTPIPLSRDDDFGVQKQVGSWGMKLYDVKRAKAVYRSDDAEVAQGVWLLSFVEFMNMGTGTNSPWNDLDFYLFDDRGWSYDAGWNKASSKAGWQFQAADIMDDINPGLML